MAVIQPLYFSGGRYSASVDRKLLAALVQSASDGTRLEGVIPANTGSNSLKVSPSSGMVLSIASGLCLVADASTQDVDTPGVYLAGVDTSAETVTIAANSTGSTRYDLVYADVSETSFTITNRDYSGSTVTITTSAAHGFVAGQTVYISGIDEFYDGAFAIATVPTTTTFTYSKAGGSTPSSTSVLPSVQIGSTIRYITAKDYNTTNANLATLTLSAGIGTQSANSLIKVKGLDSTFDGDFHLAAATTSGSGDTVITYKINRYPISTVAVTSVSSSSAAKARVPFAIKVVTGSTTTEPSLPSGTNIKLARVTVANGATSIASGDISDRRQFVTTVGGVHIYDSSNTALTYPTMSEGALRYDTSGNTLSYYDGSAWQTVSTLTLSGSGSATTAAKSDHTHSADSTYLGISQVRNADGGGSGTSVAIFPSASDTTALDASTKYLFEATIYAYYSIASANRLGFTLSPTTAFTAVNLDFITWEWVESASIDRSGYQSGTSSAITDLTTSATSNNVVINIKGIIVTDSSATSVTPSLTLPSSGSINIYKGTHVKFTNIGSSSATVIRGTWS